MVVVAAVFVDDRRLGEFRIADAIEAGDVDGEKWPMKSLW
ncbi:hypothetical protein N185_04535 [Sinorhizobium sp. GW3]|nr:hypothetical protein N185_04535 [Sinorhizobium sp. GW3]